MASLRTAADATAVIPTVLVLNGPSLNRLGGRQPEIYDATTLANVESELRTLAKELGVIVDCHQSNYEGQLIEWVHEAADHGRPVAINPEGLTHTSVVLRDVLAEVADGAGFREVHISSVHARGKFRHHLYLSAFAASVIVGCGTGGCSVALRRVSATL